MKKLKRLLIFIYVVSLCSIQMIYADCACSANPPPPCKPCLPVCFERGYPTNPSCTPAAYNEPADYELGPCPWNFWVDGSFIYWLAYEEGLDLAVSSTELNTVLQSPQNGTFTSQNTEFKPGFKIGLGMILDHDSWMGLTEYTWFRSETQTSSSAPIDPRGGINVWLFSNWFNRQTNTAATGFSSKWTLNMDLIDVALSRPYYQGTHLIFAPFGGVRAQWIRQKLNIDAAIFTSSTTTPPLAATSKNHSRSWALGPRAGFLGQWHLGWGFRLEADMAGALLFTRYDQVSHQQSPTTTASVATEVSASFHDYDTLRAGADLNLGFGWGSYSHCRNRHFDFLVTYDFQIFWDENMLRQLADMVADGTGSAPSNLYLQGLTLKAQYNF